MYIDKVYWSLLALGHTLASSRHPTHQYPYQTQTLTCLRKFLQPYLENLLHYKTGV